MSILRHHVPAAPAPVTPYSHAVEAEGLVFVTGQIGNDPAKPDAPLAAGIEAQTRRVFANLEVVLQAVGTTFQDVLFARIYLTDFRRDYDGFNAVYNAVFSDPAHLPSRTTIGVAALAKAAIVEVDFVLRSTRSGSGDLR
jgi:reactive intermediate/imine deaminase